MPRKLLWVFLLALSARALFFACAVANSDGRFTQVFPRDDGYYEIAENLIAGNGFSKEIRSPFIPDSIRAPIYPLFLAGFFYIFESYYAALIAQIIIGSIIPLLGYRIAFQLLAHRRMATVVAVVLAIEPFAILFSLTIMSETLFTALFLVGATLFLDYWKDRQGLILAYATGFFALATLARPTIQFLPLVLIFAVLFIANGRVAIAIKHSFVIAAVFLLILAPWSVRNFIQFGNPALSVQYASVPYAYLIPSLLALEKDISFMDALKQFYEGEGDIESVEDITLANASFYKKRATEILKEHPVGLTKSIGITFLTFFTHDGYLDVLRRLGLSPSLQLDRPAFFLLLESPQKAWKFVRPLIASPAILVILGRIVWVLITFCFIVGIIRYIRVPEQRAKGIFILLIIFYFAVTTIAVGLSVNARFRMPVNAFILTFAVYGMSDLFHTLRKTKRTDKQDKRNKGEIIAAAA